MARGGTTYRPQRQPGYVRAGSPMETVLEILKESPEPVLSALEVHGLLAQRGIPCILKGLRGKLLKYAKQGIHIRQGNLPATYYHISRENEVG